MGSDAMPSSESVAKELQSFEEQTLREAIAQVGCAALRPVRLSCFELGVSDRITLCAHLHCHFFQLEGEVTGLRQRLAAVHSELSGSVIPQAQAHQQRLAQCNAMAVAGGATGAASS